MGGAGSTRQLRLSYPVVVLVAIFLLPGIASLMLRGWKEAGLRSLLLLAVIPVALLVFGPLWGDVIFATSPRALRNFGLWPFLATCVAVWVFSLWRAIQDRRIAIARLESSVSGDSTDMTGVAREGQTRSESIGYGCFCVAALLGDLFRAACDPQSNAKPGKSACAHQSGEHTCLFSRVL